MSNASGKLPEVTKGKAVRPDLNHPRRGKSHAGRWFDEFMDSERVRRIGARELKVARAFPLVFGVVGAVAQGVVAWVFVQFPAAMSSPWLVKRLNLAEIMVLVSFLLSWACYNHVRWLRVRLQRQDRADMELRALEMPEGFEGQWPPRPVLTDMTSESKPQ
ncbi:MAG TPA: hypothetical protein VGK19_14385 [Capsulimonadaceae bacterium]|jgi:hypothetical protein